MRRSIASSCNFRIGLSKARSQMRIVAQPSYCHAQSQGSAALESAVYLRKRRSNCIRRTHLETRYSRRPAVKTRWWVCWYNVRAPSTSWMRVLKLDYDTRLGAGELAKDAAPACAISASRARNTTPAVAFSIFVSLSFWESDAKILLVQNERGPPKI